MRSRAGPVSADALPARVGTGTLLVTFDRQLTTDCVFHCGALTLSSRPGGVDCAVAGARSELSLPLKGLHAPLNLALSWDALAGWVRLAAWSDAPAQGAPVWCESRLDTPLSGAALTRLADESRPVAATVAGLALSNRVLPVGLRGGLAPTAKLATPRGPVLAAALRPGQMVLTADGDLAQIRWVGQDDQPIWSTAAPLRLRAPYLGLTDDLIVEGNQLIQTSGPDVEYLFGSYDIALRAGDLLGQAGTMAWRPSETMRLVRIVLDRPAALLASGLAVYGLDPWATDTPSVRLGALGSMPAALWPVPRAPIPQVTREQLLSLLQFRAA